MTKLERFHAAINGQEVDHLPVSVWLHFASEHHPGEKVAELHAAFYREYDWDYVKVMNDYRYPLPDIPEIRSEADLLRFEPLEMSHPVFAEQLKALKLLREELGPDVPIVETIFSPIQTLLRGAGNAAWNVVTAAPEAGHSMLRAVTETLLRYVAAIREIGVDGIFFSVNGANRPPAAGGLPREQFEEFVAPYDRQVLAAAEGLVRIGHIHGYDLEFDRVLDYPLEAYSWSHHHSAPSLAEASQLTDKALVGGIDEVRVFTQTPSETAADIRQAVAEAGRTKLLIGPGCTVLPDTPKKLLHHIVKTVRELS